MPGPSPSDTLVQMERGPKERSTFEHLLEIALWLVERAAYDERRMADLQRRVLELEQRVGQSRAQVPAVPEPRPDTEHAARPAAQARGSTLPRAFAPVHRRRPRPGRQPWSVDIRWSDLRLVAMIAVGVLATLTLVSLVLLAAAAYF